MTEKLTKTPKLSEKHGKRRERKTKGSLALSVFLHGLLGASLVGVSFYAGSPQKPRRIFELTFGEPPETAVIAKAEVEVLDSAPLVPEEISERDLVDGTLLETPQPLPDTTILPEQYELTPVEDWTSQQLDDMFQARDAGISLLPVEVELAESQDETVGELEDEQPNAEQADPEFSDDVEPRIPLRIEGEDPDYPRLSSRLKEQGDVILRLTLDDEGRVRGVELLESSGYIRLDEAAMSAAPKWRFDLTVEGVLRCFDHTVHFQLAR
ncbi:MAG: energy transducer TonB [Planctomycetota bacterium]|nr:energy transducer TonB [Planctomycetota bacterium]